MHTRPSDAGRYVFRYGVYMWLVDLDRPVRMPLAAAPLRRDPSPRPPGRPGRAASATNVDAYLADNGIDLDGGRILMLDQRAGAGLRLQPADRVLVPRADGDLRCVVAEVHNTYGERHCYLLRPGDRGRCEADKEFYVSPFLTVDGRYRMSFSEPGERLSVQMELHQDGARVFAASLTGRRRPLTAGNLARMAVRHPLMPQRVTALIHLHGVRLCLRRRAFSSAGAGRGPREPRPRGRRPPSMRRCAGLSPAGCSPPAVDRLGPLEVIGPRGEAIRTWHGAPRMTITRNSFFDRVATQGNDRLRRGVHGARVARGRPGRRADRVRRAPLQPGAHSAAPAARRLGAPRAAARREHARRLRPQHLAALRPVERAVRAVPGRDDDLLLRRLRGRRRAAGGRPAPQVRRWSRTWPTSARHARAGDRHRLGRHGDHPPRERVPRHHARRSPGSRRTLAARAGPRRRAWPTGRRPAARLPRRSRAATTRSSRSR